MSSGSNDKSHRLPSETSGGEGDQDFDIGLYVIDSDDEALRQAIQSSEKKNSEKSTDNKSSLRKQNGYLLSFGKDEGDDEEDDDEGFYTGTHGLHSTAPTPLRYSEADDEDEYDDGDPGPSRSSFFPSPSHKRRSEAHGTGFAHGTSRPAKRVRKTPRDLDERVQQLEDKLQTLLDLFGPVLQDVQAEMSSWKEQRNSPALPSTSFQVDDAVVSELIRQQVREVVARSFAAPFDQSSTTTGAAATAPGQQGGGEGLGGIGNVAQLDPNAAGPAGEAAEGKGEKEDGGVKIGKEEGEEMKGEP